MNEKDTLSLLHYKREKMALQHSQQIRNKIFEVKRKQFLRLKTIQELSTMLKDPTQFSDAFQPLLQLFDDEEKDIDFGYLLYYWGILDDLVELLKNFNKLTEQQLIDLIKLIAFIIQSKDSIHCFINTKAPHILEYILGNHCNIQILENCLLILGNLENYQCSDYFKCTVIQRLKQYLYTMDPLPVNCLITMSFMIKNRDLPQQEDLQRELIMLQNDEILFEAIQYVEKLNIDQKLMKYLIESVDLNSDPKQMRTKLLITLIYDNLNKENAIMEIRDLLDKCLQSGKLLIFSCLFKLAQNYMIQSGYPYINQQIENRLMQLLVLFDEKRDIPNASIQKSMMQYLEALHILFPETRLSNLFYEKILDTMQSSHLRLISIVITRNKEFVRNLANLNIHKMRLLELAKKNDEAKELLKQIYL